MTEAVHRVRFAELAQIEIWLTPKMKGAWPNISEQGFGHWLRGALGDRALMFICSDNMAGLFEAQLNVLDPRPLVVERFVRLRKAVPVAEVLAFYAFARDWAKAIDAAAFRFGCDTDVKIAHLVEAWQAAAEKEKTPLSFKTTPDVVLPL